MTQENAWDFNDKSPSIFVALYHFVCVEIGVRFLDVNVPHNEACQFLDKLPPKLNVTDPKQPP